MTDIGFFYFLGIIMAAVGWISGRSIEKKEQLDRLMNSGLGEWEIVKLRLAMDKAEPFAKLKDEKILTFKEFLIKMQSRFKSLRTLMLIVRYLRFKRY